MAAAFERQRDLRANRARHELGLGILKHGARDAAEPRGAMLARVEARQRHVPGKAAAIEVRHEAARRPQQRRLAVT